MHIFQDVRSTITGSNLNPSKIWKKPTYARVSCFVGSPPFESPRSDSRRPNGREAPATLHSKPF